MVAVPKSPWRQRAAVAAGIAGVAVVGLLIAADAYGHVSGCGSVDPTDPSNYSTGQLVNDTKQPVVVGDCQGDYCVGPANIPPGGAAPVRGACAATGADMTSYQVTRSSTRQTVGYVAIANRRSQTSLVFRVSNLSLDRVTGTPSN